MKKVITILLAGMATAALLAGGAGEYTANRMPGTNLLWTAGRTAEEISAASASNAAALASATNALTAALAGEAALRVSGTNDLYAAITNEAALRVSGTNDLYAAITNEAALRVSGTNALHVEISGATAAASTATNQSASALAIAQSATNTASTALALGVTATNAAATANALAATATNDSATALALSVTATNAASEAAYQSGIAYLYATNAAAQAAGVYTPATNAAAVAALAWSRANLAYTLAGSVYGYATNAIDIATNAAAQVATAYPAATNALAQATNATAVSAAAYVLASNAWDTATNAYVTATNAQHRVGLAETNKADKTELANYETVQDAQIVAAVALDAQTLAESAVPTNHPRWIAALTNETDAAALAALAGYKPSALWEEAQASDTLMRIEGATNLVFYSVPTVPVTNYSVTYSEGFRYDDGEGVILYPPVTNAVTPNTVTNGWNYYTQVFGAYEYFYISTTNDVNSMWQPASFATYPQALLPDASGYGPTYGTATVSRVIVYPTNELYRLDIPALMNGDAITNETDLAALRTYHYGSPDIVESPAEWFVFDGAGTITGVNVESVTNWNIVIPWEIGGVPVTTIGSNAFAETVVSSLIAPKTLVAVKNWAFQGCTSLKAVVLPSVTEFTVAEFSGCSSLLSVTFSGNAPYAWENLYFEAPNVTNYVTDPHATGWGKTFPTTGDYQRPVVRPGLHTDALVLNGTTYTNIPTTDVSGLATTQSVAAVAGGLDLAAITLNNHTANGTIGSDAHLVTGDRALIDSVPSLATTNALAAVSGALGTHTNDAPAHVSASDRSAWYGVTNAPVWVLVTNAVGAVTITNDLERPVTLYATGDVAVAFSALRPPLPMWLEAYAEGTSTVSFADAYAVGGFAWQTNRVNIFAVWASGTNTFVTPVTTRGY